MTLNRTNCTRMTQNRINLLRLLIYIKYMTTRTTSQQLHLTIQTLQRKLQRLILIKIHRIHLIFHRLLKLTTIPKQNLTIRSNRHKFRSRFRLNYLQISHRRFMAVLNIRLSNWISRTPRIIHSHCTWLEPCEEDVNILLRKCDAIDLNWWIQCEFWLRSVLHVKYIRIECGLQITSHQTNITLLKRLSINRDEFLRCAVCFWLENNLIQWPFYYLRILKHRLHMHTRWNRLQCLRLLKILNRTILRIIYLQGRRRHLRLIRHSCYVILLTLRLLTQTSNLFWLLCCGLVQHLMPIHLHRHRIEEVLGHIGNILHATGHILQLLKLSYVLLYAGMVI